MISLAARDRKLTERLLLALRRQTVIGHALSVRASPHSPHFARQRHPAQVDLAVVRDDAAALVAVAVARAPNGTGLPRWVSVIRIFIPTWALKLARTIAHGWAPR